LHALRSGEWRSFRDQLAEVEYDCVIDAQGLLKSAWLTRLARGPRHGLDRRSAREPLAARVYQHAHAVARGQHAVDRVRQLFAQALDYACDTASDPDYGLTARFSDAGGDGRDLVFLHGTTWESKLWPQRYWRQLLELAGAAGYRIRLVWGNAEERQRAGQLADGVPYAEVLPRLPLDGIAALLARTTGIVAVDSGLGHLAAALGRPTVSIYGATDARLTGTRGRHQYHLDSGFICAPCLRRHCNYRGPAQLTPACYIEITPQRVWQVLQDGMRQVRHD
jgi:heptosyltransferase-1